MALHASTSRLLPVISISAPTSAAAAASQGRSLGSDDARRAVLASVLAGRQRVEGEQVESEEGGGEQGGAGGGGAAAAVWAQVVGSSRFVSGLGLADAMPCLLFNGVFYPSPKVGPLPLLLPTLLFCTSPRPAVPSLSNFF
ncbi:unnamed protein product [Closterium sp. NIES-54]